MPKKIFLLILSIILVSGCVNIENENYSNIIDESIKSNASIYNTYRKGYKFYLPKGLYVSNNKEYNEIIKGKKELYYLYVDVISYLNKSLNSYKENSSAFYSKLITYNDKSGYIEINSVNEKYLVEIVYNYAKIEVMVESDDLRSAIANAIIILSSISYNDVILASARDTLLDYNEKPVDIFKTDGKEKSNFLEYVELDEYDDTELPDYDVIK